MTNTTDFRQTTRHAAYRRGFGRGLLYGFALGLGTAIAIQFLGAATQSALGQEIEIIRADPAYPQYDPRHPCDFGYEHHCPIAAIPPEARWILEPPVPPARGRPAWTYDPPVPERRPALDAAAG